MVEALSFFGRLADGTAPVDQAGIDSDLVRGGIRWPRLADGEHPDPAMLHAAMAACDSDPSRTVMVGDTAHDHTMARSAGVLPLGVAWGFHTVEEQRAAGARHVAGSFSELTVVLAGSQLGITACTLALGAGSSLPSNVSAISCTTCHSGM